MKILGDILIDGEATPRERASISVLDLGLLRGYGCFEALRSYEGRPFRLGAHLDRLEGSAARLKMAMPVRSDLEAWIRDRAREGGDCVVRIFVTAGSSLEAPGSDGRVIVFAEALPELPPALAVGLVRAPWHPDGEPSELTGAKTLSYAPNVAATLAAVTEGFDDALLIGRSGYVLEGPTYSVAWVTDGVLETPSLDLGILGSITRSVALEVAAAEGLPVIEGRFPPARVTAAAEVMALSTVKEVKPIGRIGAVELPVGPVTERLAEGFRRVVASELA